MGAGGIWAQQTLACRLPESPWSSHKLRLALRAKSCLKELAARHKSRTCTLAPRASTTRAQKNSIVVVFGPYSGGVDDIQMGGNICLSPPPEPQSKSNVVSSGTLCPNGAYLRAGSHQITIWLPASHIATVGIHQPQWHVFHGTHRETYQRSIYIFAGFSVSSGQFFTLSS